MTIIAILLVIGALLAGSLLRRGVQDVPEELAETSDGANRIFAALLIVVLTAFALLALGSMGAGTMH